MPRRRVIALAALALVLIAAPYLPHGGNDGGPEGTLSSSDPFARATAGAGKVTPAMKAEIDAVVAEGRTTARAARGVRQGPADLVRNQVRCADLEGQRYCLHTGWTNLPEYEVVGALAARAQLSARRAPIESTETTGDLDLLDALRRRESMRPAERAAADRAELVEAAESVAKVWLLRHQIQGQPLPEDFLEAHPEVNLARESGTQGLEPTAAASASPAGQPLASTPTPQVSTTTTGTATAVKPGWKYEQHGVVLRRDRVAEQTRSYWCGPTTMQMIGWGWSGIKRSQGTWAERLHTSTDGTGITDMVRVTNQYTGWDNDKHAGRYVTLDISDWSYGQWWLLNMRHYADYKAPVILHPVLLKRFFSYLDDDASGHFQVGRGFDKNGADANLISFFEPWNQQRFDPSEPYIARVQWRSAYRSYRANQAHFQHNIGV